MSDRYQSILLFGAPGVGKGTQGKVLGAIPGFFHMSMGDAFRALDPTSELGRVFKQYSTRGELVPDEFTIRLWHEFLEGEARNGVFEPRTDLLVLDGVPRNPDQVKLLGPYSQMLRVIHLIASDEEAMIDRLRRRALKENRADDAKEEVIRRRWEVYREETEPVLSTIDPSLIREIDCMGTPAAVMHRILGEVAPLAEEIANRRADDSEAA